MHHNGTISGRSKMFYTTCKSLNKSICTTSGNMIHHFIYGLGVGSQKKFSKYRSIKFGFQCFKCIYCIFKFTLYMVSQPVLHSSDSDPHTTHTLIPLITIQAIHPCTQLKNFVFPVKMLCVSLGMAA